jgi:Fe-S-cluster containining protein
LNAVADKKIPVDEYLKTRSRWFNEASDFSCPESCGRYGCTEPDLHITVSLVDLVSLARASGLGVLEIFTDKCKVGFDPLGEREPWAGRVSMELRKPCAFLQQKACSVYAGRPMACALFPEAFFILEGGEEALSKAIFRPFPCIRSRAPVSPRRATILRNLLLMSGQEIFLSDFYLFEISPLRIDLKNIAGKSMEGLETSREGMTKLPIGRLEELVSNKVQETPFWGEWMSKLSRLDQPGGVEEFWKMKPWTDEIMETIRRNPVNIAYQFTEGDLQSLRFFK